MKLTLFISLITLFVLEGFTQTQFNGIKIQGEFSSSQPNNSPINLNIIVLNIDMDTLFEENHLNIELYDQIAFHVVLGEGVFISGTSNNLSEIDWPNVEIIEILNLDNQNVLGTYSILNQPYAYHSKFNLKSPIIIQLEDTQNNDFEFENTLLKYDGLNFVESNQIISDSIYFANYSNWSLHSDTTEFSLNNLFSDTSGFSFHTNNSNYSFNNFQAINTDSSGYSDTSSFSYNSLNNWSLNGNQLNSSPSSLGSNNYQDLIFKTNNNTKLVLSKDGYITNNNSTSGFHIAADGVLFNINLPGTIAVINNSHLYMNQSKSAVHMGSPISNLDTLFGQSSFAFGKDVGTNGIYSTVFGNNTYGDSAVIFGNTHESVSSFAIGTNCNVAYVSVAIGYNSKALFYRNVAIGKDVYVGPANGLLPSAAIGIGNNVRSTGATSWAMGNNVSASGHFSYAIGSNASSNLKVGSIVFGDYSTSDTVFNTANNQFMVRADSGFVFYTSSDLTMGVTLNHGDGSWNMISDRNKKANLTLLSSDSFNYFSNKINVYQWQYLNQNQIHIGPMAQDFNSILGYGELPNYINSSDMDGSILLGIKNLNSKIITQDKSEEILLFESNIHEEKNKLDDIQKKLDELYEKMDN